MLGSFLEISIQTADMLASLDFYSRLGFERAPVHDVWPHPYMALTDGNVYLGLHQYSFPSPSLTFVLPDLRHQIPVFEALGIRLAFAKLGDAEFNEAGFYDPNRQMVTLLETRTCSPLPRHPSEAVCGYFDEYRLPAIELAAGCRFWEDLGLIRAALDEAAAKSARFSTGGLNLRLCREPLPAGPQLVFSHPQPDQLAELLAGRGVSGELAVAGQFRSLELTSPEGQRLLICSSNH
ncbi:MAG: hypothetical protein KGL13_07485 [Gammaproteobacteria bacterium]|nr:hypothetical protein [Gammaproteobacteria bacterium]MDE2346295.1 hypothetical protein [Gammaproteobacteria bacterium]